MGEALYSQERSLTLQKLLKTPLVEPPGTRHVYSDVDFLLLGMVIENVTGQPLDAYVESTFYKPLGLHHVMFNPLAKGIVLMHDIHARTVEALPIVIRELGRRGFRFARWDGQKLVIDSVAAAGAAPR